MPTPRPARRTPARTLRLALLGAVFATQASGAPDLPAGFIDEQIAAGLHFSSCLAVLPDGRVIATEHGLHQVVLIQPPGFEVMGRIDSVRFGGEQGLFGVAVDPRWPAEPYLYLHYSYDGAPRIHVSRFTISGDLDGTQNGSLTLDSLSEHHVLVDLPDSSTFHNGGQLHFGPDSMLYISLGDDARSCGVQSKSLLRGKILRVDVRNLPPGPGGPPAFADITPADNPFVGHADPGARLVLHFGLRNPYSFSIDPPTGHLVIADVGANRAEELNLATSPGLNFGWPLYEGHFPGIACVTTDTMGVSPEFPVHSYSRPTPSTPVAIISGGVYRSVPGGVHNFPPEYEGSIFFSDVGAAFLRRLIFDGVEWRLADSVSGQPSAEDWGRDFDGVTAYAMGTDGALWYAKYSEDYLSFTGEIRRIRWEAPTSDVPPHGAATLGLAPPVPLPARDRVRLTWTLAHDANVTLDVFDVRGARVRRIAAGERFAAGSHTRTWALDDEQGRRLGPGLYWLRLANGRGEEAVRRLVVTR
jgi:glucose/arabinose dehydrogenase